MYKHQIHLLFMYHLYLLHIFLHLDCVFNFSNICAAFICAENIVREICAITSSCLNICAIKCCVESIYVQEICENRNASQIYWANRLNHFELTGLICSLWPILPDPAFLCAHFTRAKPYAHNVRAASREMRALMRAMCAKCPPEIA